MDSRIPEQEVESAAANLARPEIGQIAMRDLLRFMERRGLTLDGANQRGTLTLLVAAWQGRAQFVRDCIREHLEAAGHRVG